MHRRILVVALLGLTTAPALAQDEDIPTRPKPVESRPTDASTDAPCGQWIERCRTEYKILWLERDAPPAPNPELKEHSCPEVQCMQELDWIEERSIRVETTLKPREVLKEVCITEMIPEKCVDPLTGCCTTVLKPVTTTKVVKDYVLEPACEEKVIVVKRPCIKTVEKAVSRKTLHIEEGPPKPRKETYGVLVPIEIKERVFVPAKPVCPSCSPPYPSSCPVSKTAEELPEVLPTLDGTVVAPTAIE
jgi:hypothetical protein